MAIGEMAAGEKARLVIVDDEEDLREMVADYLGAHGFSVRTADSGASLDAHLAVEPADLVLLDVNMPKEDGFSVARRLRKVSRVPIVMVTAAGEVIDRVVGLEIGADDYVTKPFDLRELRARIRSILRRLSAPAPAAPTLDASPNPAFGRRMLDLESRRLVGADGSEEPLTVMEFDLLRVFAQNPNRTLSRDDLLELAHHKMSDMPDRSIDIRITRLRRKIEDDPAKPQVIRTVRGAGYVYTPPKKPA